MKKLFRKKSAKHFAVILLASFALNVTAQTWSVPTNGNSVGSSDYLGTSSGAGTDPFVFKTNGIERMRITTAGLIGLGDFSSSSLFSPLQIGTSLNKISIGTAPVPGSYLGNRGYIGLNASYDGTNWNVFSGDDDGDHGGAVISTSEDGFLQFHARLVGGQNSNQVLSNTSFFTNSLKLQVGPNGVEVPTGVNMWVGGYIAVGGIQSYPSGYKLYVKDGILTEKIKVAVYGTSNWSDFVFDRSYKLMSLHEVENFIQENKHLPDVPSAEEMVENGLDVATMDAKLLQKIEELTLYMIEIKKENEKLSAQTTELKKEIDALKGLNK